MLDQAGLSTALEESAKSGGEQRARPEISENFQLPLLPGSAPEKNSAGNIVNADKADAAETKEMSGLGNGTGAAGMPEKACGAEKNGGTAVLAVSDAEDAEALRLQEEDAEADIDCNYSVTRRGAGRPKGSRNRSTEAWRSFFLRQNKSPLMFLGGIYSVPTSKLASDIGVEMEDALKYQIAAAQAVLPYVHQKQPIAVERSDDILPVINITMTRNEVNVMTSSQNGQLQLKPEYREIELIDDEEFRQIAAEDADCKIQSNNSDLNDNIK